MFLVSFCEVMEEKFVVGSCNLFFLLKFGWDGYGMEKRRNY